MRRVGVALVLAVAACGRKSLPVAPETVRPRAPATLAAASTPEGVRLTWLRPLQYSGGQRMHDLDRFLVERAPGEGAPATFDRDAKPGERYLYRVIAVTRDGSRSPPAGPVAIQYEAGKGAP